MRREDHTRLDSSAASAADRASVGAINRLASRQHGLVTRRQLLELGMGPRAIDRRVEARRLIRVRRGLYRLGPIAQPLEPEMAAILAVGGGAVISHRTAAAIYQLLPHPAKPDFVDVTVKGRQPGKKPGIRIHRTARLPPNEITRRHRMPITTAARTLLDITPDLTQAELEQALAQAHRKRLVSPRALDALLARYPARPGTPAIRTLAHGPRKPKFTRSKPERRLLEALRRAGLPEPETNAPLAGYEIDLLWRERKLAVEVDGEPFHSAQPDRRRDYARDARLGEHGFTVLRIDADLAVERAIALVASALARATR
jgi:very-short-patch-repair endonuclease